MAKRKILFLLFLIMFFLLKIALITITMAKQTDLVKATWIWNTSIIKSELESKYFFTFSKKREINEVYLQIDKRIPTDKYKKFIYEAHQNDIRVFALDGQPSWGLISNSGEPLQFIDWVVNYNKEVDKNEAFDGIQFDIEPYLLAEWSSNQEKIIQEWKGISKKLVREAHGAKLSISCVIPFWLDQIVIEADPKAKVLSEWMINCFDSIIIMAYRNIAEGPNGIMDLSRPEVFYASLQKKPIIVAVETMETIEGKNVTFYNKGLKKLDVEMAKVMEGFGSYSYFKGIAVHHYESYRDLKP